MQQSMGHETSALQRLESEQAAKLANYNDILQIWFDRGRPEQTMLRIRRDHDESFLVYVTRHDVNDGAVRRDTLPEALEHIAALFKEALGDVAAHDGIPRNNPRHRLSHAEEYPLQVILHDQADAGEAWTIRITETHDFGMNYGVGHGLMKHTRHQTMPQAILSMQGEMLQRAEMLSRIYATPRPTDISLWGVIGFLAQNAADHALRMRDAMAMDRAKLVAETPFHAAMPVLALR